MALMITQNHLEDAFYFAREYPPEMIFEQMGGTAYFGEYSESVLQTMEATYSYDPHAYITQWLGKNPDVAAEWAYQNEAARAQASAMFDYEPVFEEGTQNVIGAQTKVMPQTTTNVGTVKAGALRGKIPIGTLIAGTAIGAGVGLKEVASHPKFWNDLSNAVFNDLKNPGTWISKPLCETETADIIWREMQDGSIQAYCDKRSIDKVIKNLYDYNVLNNGSVVPLINQPGYQQVSYGALDFSVLMAAANVITGPVSTQALEAAYAGAIAYAGSRPYNAISGAVGSSTVSVTLYNMPDYLTIDQYPNGLYVYRPQDYGVVVCNVTYDPDTLEVISVSQGSSYGSTVTIGSVYQSAGNLGFCSNVGSNVTPWNDAVIPNPDATQAPSDMDDFWSVFAEWLANSFVDRTYNPYTNNYVDTTYVPITAPETNWQTDPITGDQSKVWEGIYDFVSPFSNPTTTPVNNPSPWIYQSLFNQGSPDINIPTSTPWTVNPNFPQIGFNPFGSSPTIVAPSSGVSSGSKLYSVYNPSQANIDALGSYLWNSSILDTIAKFFQNNPLDAIISLHMLYATPTTGSNKNIVLGYLDSGVSSPTVTSQYVDIACGDVQVSEAYGNALDYTGVSVQVFLPFIGYKTLKTKEVMNSRLEIDYKVDVYTGTCLSMIYSIRPNTRQLLYTFEGNCSVQIPLTASDRTRLIGGLITAGVSAYTGNPAGVVGGIASIKSDIQRSGGFSGNAGAMNVKKPFLVISRAVDTQPSGYNSQYGYPNNKIGYLINFKGYTRCKSVHVDIPTATDAELVEIESMLKEGIII